MSKASLFERYPRTTIFLTVIIGVLLLDVVAANVQKHSFRYRFKKYDHEKEYRTASDVYHHGLLPNKVVPITRFGNKFYSVKTNSLGFRDFQPREVPLRSDRYRILLMGDSFTEGVGCEYEDTYAGILTRTLAKRGIEVLNGAAVSYSPSIYYAKVRYLLEDVGLDFDDLFVMLDLTDAVNEACWYRTDEQGRVLTNEEGRRWEDRERERHEEELKRQRDLFTRIERILKRDSILLYWTVRKTHDLFFDKDVFQDYFAINNWWGLWPSDSKIFELYGRRGLEGMVRYMDKLYELCRQRGIPLSVGIYPWIDQIARRETDNVYVRTWRQWCAERNVTFYNLYPAFINDQTDVRKTLEENFIYCDIHWNENGHRRIAEALLRLGFPRLLKEAAGVRPTDGSTERNAGGLPAERPRR